MKARALNLSLDDVNSLRNGHIWMQMRDISWSSLVHGLPKISSHRQSSTCSLIRAASLQWSDTICAVS